MYDVKIKSETAIGILSSTHFLVSTCKKIDTFNLRVCLPSYAANIFDYTGQIYYNLANDELGLLKCGSL
jgi:hypothetical protein